MTFAGRQQVRTSADHYRAQALETVGPVQLVLMIYDRTLLALRQVTAASMPRDIGLVNRELQRSQDLLTELQLALDFDRGGDVAPRLWSLYDYAIGRLVEANVTKDLAGVDEVIGLVGQLRAAWYEACCRTEAGVG